MANTASKLSLLDYGRISETIYSVLSAESGDPRKACIFFAIAGAEILKQHYAKHSAQVVAGAAAYRIGERTNDVLVLGEQAVSGITSSEQTFHCWVEDGDGWAYDFQAPLFPEIIGGAGTTAPCPVKMFQRRLADQKTTLDQLRHVGDFIYIPNPALTAGLLLKFQAKPAYVDLVGIMVDWHKKAPKKMSPVIGVGDSRGRVKQVPLRRFEIVGAW